ncbi:MAG TPA: ComF family protein [Caulobacteraceae bacterium]|nr:ComF family protein [Caulobacteraceae bacterium]
MPTLEIIRPSLSGLRRASRGLLDLALPPRALDEAPGAPGATQSRGLTAGAWTRIAFIEAPFCDLCGAPFEFDLGIGALCAHCQSRRAAFDHLRAACLYDEYSRDLILKLKHADRTDLSGLFARWIARAAADLLPELDAVTAVPLHHWRLLRRRYNQAAEIARPLARLAGLRYLPDPVVRTRATQSQGGRSGSGRRRNVAGVFSVPERWRRRIAGRRILLIDDVLTTGATAEGCCRALKSAGAARVDVAVIARVKEMSPRSTAGRAGPIYSEVSGSPPA